MTKRQTTTTAPTMAEAARRRLEAKLNAPDLSDFENPVYMFSTTSTNLLRAIALGLIDPVALAKATLANRGVGLDGEWGGFEAAKTIWGVK